MNERDSYDSSELPEDTQLDNAELEVAAVRRWFSQVVDNTMLDNIEKVEFNMNTPFEDTLRLTRRKVASDSLTTLILRRRQNLYDRGYDAHLSEYVMKSVEVRDIQKDRLVDSRCYELQIDGVVMRRDSIDGRTYRAQAAGEGNAANNQREPATPEDIRDLEGLIREE